MYSPTTGRERATHVRPHVLAVAGDVTTLAEPCDCLAAHGFRVARTRWESGIHADVGRDRPSLIVLRVERSYRFAAWRTVARLQAEDDTYGIPILLCTADAYLLASFSRRHAMLVEPFAGQDLLTSAVALLGLEAPPRSPRRPRSERSVP